MGGEGVRVDEAVVRRVDVSTVARSSCRVRGGGPGCGPAGVNWFACLAGFLPFIPS